MLIGARWRPTIPFSILAGRPAGLPGCLLPAPSLSFLDPGALGSLLAPAVAVAALAALESRLSASVAVGMTVGQKHDPDRELFRLTAVATLTTRRGMAGPRCIAL